jgi:WD40 repeat protein
VLNELFTRTLVPSPAATPGDAAQAPPVTPRTLEGHSSPVSSVAVTSDGRFAVSGSADTTLRVWDLASGRTLRTLEGHPNDVEAVAVTPDGHRAVSGSEDGTLRVWDLASGETLRTLEGHSSWISAVAVTPDGRCVVSSSGDGTLRVWDLASGETLRIVEGHRLGRVGAVNVVAVTPDGRSAVSGSGAGDGTLLVWDVASGETLRTMEGHERGVSAVAVTPDSSCVVSGCSDGTLRVWDLASGRALRTLEGHGEAWAVAVTPDGRSVVSGSSDGTLRVWDLASGRMLRTLEGHRSGVSAVAVTPDGRFAVSGSHDGTLRVWDLAGSSSTRQAPGTELCKRCGRSIKTTDYTCPYCGNTQWGLIGCLGVFSLLCLGAAALGSSQIADSGWRSVVMWGGGILGAMCLLGTIGFVVRGVRNPRKPLPESAFAGVGIATPASAAVPVPSPAEAPQGGSTPKAPEASRSSGQDARTVKVTVRISGAIEGSAEYLGTYEMTLPLDMPGSHLLNTIAGRIIRPNGPVMYYTGYQLYAGDNLLTCRDLHEKTLRSLGVKDGDVVDFLDLGGSFV